MSQSATWDTLQVARDARLCWRPEVEAALLAEVAPDFEYVRASARVRARIRAGWSEARILESMVWMPGHREWRREYLGQWLPDEHVDAGVDRVRRLHREFERSHPRPALSIDDIDLRDQWHYADEARGPT